MFGGQSQTPTLDNFLAEIASIVQSRNGQKLQDFLQLEPPLSQIYQTLVQELRGRYPAGRDSDLDTRCDALVPKDPSDGMSVWSAFPVFMKQYFTFLRDLNIENLLETYNMLKALLNQCMLALSDTQMGVIVLPTVLYLAKVMAKLALGLDRSPELIAHLVQKQVSAGGEEAAEKVTLVESSANVVREAFIKCLSDKGGLSGPGRRGKPEGKRVGIYQTANLCLKLLFQCRKSRNAEQMFVSINAQSPPLSYFPASQRVTYLYYLGRYLFSNNHFYRAQAALQEAYNQCHQQAFKQKRLILTYLVASNIILGRFPSQYLLQKPEAAELAQNFVPLCRIIKQGDIVAFRQYLDVNSQTADWFRHKQILLEIRDRCEILVWRSLIRRVFIVAGFHGETGQAKGPPPFLYLRKVQAVARYLQSARVSSAQADEYIDPDFADVDVAMQECNYQEFTEGFDSGYYDDNGRWIDLSDTNQADEDDDTADEGYVDDANNKAPLMLEIESIFSSLIEQDLLHGYLVHANPRYAIPNSKARGALATGFPNIWQVLSNKNGGEDVDVPGWVQDEKVQQSSGPTPFGGKLGLAGGFGAAAPFGGGGRVVNLSGAKPVGAFAGS